MNFQESMTISNAHTKKSGNLSYAPRTIVTVVHDVDDLGSSERFLLAFHYIETLGDLKNTLSVSTDTIKIFILLIIGLNIALVSKMEHFKCIALIKNLAIMCRFCLAAFTY